VRGLTAIVLLALVLGGCDCGGKLSAVHDAGVKRCRTDADCAQGQACNASIGLCHPVNECGPDMPCPMADQICVANAMGSMVCNFKRCTMDSDCTALNCPSDQVTSCLQGGCQCGPPCQGGCPPTQGCCIPMNKCEDLPAKCMGMTCPLGQFLSVTSSGAWSTGDCKVEGESCTCQILPPLPIGDIGLYSALAFSSSSPVMSAYNLDYGDLMFGTVQTGGTIAWEFVDGVPTTSVAITGDIHGPRNGNSAKGPDVGIYTDIAGDARGRIHIAYEDRDKGALKYALGMPGNWHTHYVDGETTAGDTGLYASLILDVGSRPRIAYLSAREVSQTGARSTVLRLSFTLTATPASTSDWAKRDIETYDLTSAACADRCNPGEVCRASDQACILPDTTPCAPACASMQACVQSVCTNIETLPPFRDLPLGRGLWPSMQLIAGGGVMIAYYDRVDHNLKIAQIQGPDLRAGTLTTAIVDGAGSAGGSTDDAGLYPSLFVTATGVHVTYMNSTRRALWYRQLDSSLRTMIAEEIETGLGMGSGPDGELIGADSALVVDGTGGVRVAYQDATVGSLKYARRMGANTWQITTLAGNEMPYRGSFGFYTDQALDASSLNAVVSTYRYFLSAPNGPDNGIEIFNPQ
jgi:hypothetical protein